MKSKPNSCCQDTLSYVLFIPFATVFLLFLIVLSFYLALPNVEITPENMNVNVLCFCSREGGINE